MDFKGNEKTQRNKRKFLQYYMHAGMNIKLACGNAGISRQHVYTWLKEDKVFRMDKEQIDFGTARFATSRLLKKAKDGDTKALIALKSRAEKHIKNMLKH